MINRANRQLLLALFWFVSAYLAIGMVGSWDWAWRCAWLNLIIGMIALLIATRSPLGERLFYEGPLGDEDSLWLVGVLWAIPAAITFLAVLWWLMWQLGIFDW